MAKNNPEMTEWTGWVGFAGIMLYLVGFFHIIAGITALFNQNFYVVTEKSLWVFNTAQWGWVHIIGGLIVIWAASSLMKGHVFGRIFAVLVALASAIANMAFVPVYPIWSILMIVIDVLVIYAVVVHADELKD